MSSAPPAWLSVEARAVWDQLEASGKAAGADVDALTVYCCAVADFGRAQQALDQTGQVIRGARGGAVRSPLNLVKAENAAVIVALARQLGLAAKGDSDEPPAPAPGRWRNSAATERTITALRKGGRLEEVDSAATALARHLARALDSVDAARYPAQVASLARVQLTALRTLRGVDEEEGGAGIDELLAALSAPVGDTPQP
jgi:P27 family predicted phage terminase small subunit